MLESLHRNKSKVFLESGLKRDFLVVQHSIQGGQTEPSVNMPVFRVKNTQIFIPVDRIAIKELRDMRNKISVRGLEPFPALLRTVGEDGKHINVTVCGCYFS